MNLKLQNFIFSIVLFYSCTLFAQDVSLLTQFNGRFDFTFIGNTLNPQENSFQTSPSIVPSSSATLSLDSQSVIKKAYLYWAGSGTGDFEITLNSTSITAERTFAYQRNNFGLILDYFSAFKDITELVKQTGNGIYTLSDIDISDVIDDHFTRKTNFAGWAIIIIYQNKNLPVNQINVYDGLQAVPNALSINLTDIEVVNNLDSKIGFVAWEGDSNISVNETLKINDYVVEQLPLNPANNAFNGTNSITGSSTLYNMDLDIYDIQNYVQKGATSMDIELTSGQDVVMINAVVTKFTAKKNPIIIYNYISANNDTSNPTFFIEGLRDIYLNFKIEIYNRWGQLVWTGNNTTPDWDGLSNQEVRLDDSTISPRGTYYYIIYLNDPDYPEPIIGYLYLHKEK
ncbi:gliding motility-associated C-terminal domain-containing protein [Flavobacterium sp.]|uniref:gliding motility-associated C-terminal domain-containing protein n=1 Tax=Flavobacterium sp. TaxID=239 RepID=UPI0037BFA36E